MTISKADERWLACLDRALAIAPQKAYGAGSFDHRIDEDEAIKIAEKFYAEIPSNKRRSWREEPTPSIVPVRPAFEPVDALPADAPLTHRDVLATALEANPQLREVIALRGGLFGDWANDGLIPDIAPSKLAMLSVDAWLAWRSARSGGTS